MDAIPLRRDLVVEMKRETIKNVKILSIVQSIPQYIARLVLEDNVLEKPTQSIFNQLAYFLVRIIDHKVSTALPWPIYDSLTERKFRNELGIFISHYSNKGLLDSVKTSYLVNPGFYKVTWLIYQMSQLAVQKVLESKMHKKNQIDRYKDMTSRYKSKDNNFMEEVKNETEIILSKFSNYLHKRKSMEIIAEKMRSKITDMETKISCGDAQKFLDNIVDVFVGKHNLSEEVKSDILKIKNVFVPAPFFDRWLSQVDQQLDQMESKWDEKMNPFIQTCQETMLYTETLVARHVGDADKDSYMVQYNHDTDEINTTELQNQVNSQQKYILRNLTMDRTLNFPNLIRAYIIAIGHIMKGESVGDDIYKFNEYLSGGQQNFREVVLRLRDVMNRVMVAEAKLQPSSVTTSREDSLRNFAEIPSLPDLSSIRSTKELHQPLFENFTPLGMSKYQFNLQRKTMLHTFVKPQMKIPSFLQGPTDDFLKRVNQSARIGSYDQLNSTQNNYNQLNSTQNFHNISKIPQMNPANETIAGVSYNQLNSTQNFHNISKIPQINPTNETIAGVSTGYTKQQLLRLLSTKNSSSSKKFKHSYERPNINIKKGGLFNESVSSNESNVLFRSNSSPNLYENRETRRTQRTGQRQLSVMVESFSCSLPDLEMSGIVALEKDSICEQTPPVMPNSQKQVPVRSKNFPNRIKDLSTDSDKEFVTDKPLKRTSIEFENRTVTPQNNSKPIPKTSSLEKIINRYKKVRASGLYKEEYNEFRTIAEEGENMFSANKMLLPDHLGPSCSGFSQKAGDSLEEIDMDTNVRRRPRESLGTLLGVDHTFLDQFDLID